MPADLLVRMAAETAAGRHGEPLASADLAMHDVMPPGLPRLSDAVSGGTFQSVVAITGLEDAGSVTDSAALIDDPALAATRARHQPDRARAARRRGRRGRRADGAGAVHQPGGDPPQRGSSRRAPRDASRTRSATARASRSAGSPATLPLRWAAAGAMSASQYAMRALAQSGPSVRQPVARVLGAIGPASGFGPDEERMRHWHWTMSVRGQTPAGNVVHTRLDADGHPGYLSTAQMVGEAGVQLVSAGATPRRSRAA